MQHVRLYVREQKVPVRLHACDLRAFRGEEDESSTMGMLQRMLAHSARVVAGRASIPLRCSGGLDHCRHVEPLGRALLVLTSNLLV
jgi:hypothetical protein